MPKVDHYKLRYGPYATPRFRYGQTVTCMVRGKVTITGLTDAPIPWPTCQPRSTQSIILFGSLARAVRRESNQAIARAWGVSGQTVTLWRKALGVRRTEGDTALRVEMSTHEPWAKRALRAMYATLSSPERGEKISAALKGRKKSPEHAAKMRAMNIGREPTDEARHNMSVAAKRRGERPVGLLGREWTPDEDALIHTMKAKDAAKLIGRTIEAVKARRRRLGLPDRRALWRKKTD